MPAPLLPIGLGIAALFMLAKKQQASAGQVDIQKLPNTPEGNALKLYAYAMGTTIKNDVGKLEEYAQAIEKLGVRPDLVAAIRARKQQVLSGIGT